LPEVTDAELPPGPVALTVALTWAQSATAKVTAPAVVREVARPLDSVMSYWSTAPPEFGAPTVTVARPEPGWIDTVGCPGGTGAGGEGLIDVIGAALSTAEDGDGVTPADVPCPKIGTNPGAEPSAGPVASAVGAVAGPGPSPDSALGPGAPSPADEAEDPDEAEAEIETSWVLAMTGPTRAA